MRACVRYMSFSAVSPPESLLFLYLPKNVLLPHTVKITCFLSRHQVLFENQKTSLYGLRFFGTWISVAQLGHKWFCSLSFLVGLWPFAYVALSYSGHLGIRNIPSLIYTSSWLRELVSRFLRSNKYGNDWMNVLTSCIVHDTSCIIYKVHDEGLN